MLASAAPSPLTQAVKDFERLTGHLLDRTETTTELVLRQAKLKWKSIDRVLLVGGATRMPMVVAMLKRVTGSTKLDRSISPDESVSARCCFVCRFAFGGAPGFAGQFSFKLVNVNSHSLGIIGIESIEQLRPEYRSYPQEFSAAVPSGLNSVMACGAIKATLR